MEATWERIGDNWPNLKPPDWLVSARSSSILLIAGKSPLGGDLDAKKSKKFSTSISKVKDKNEKEIDRVARLAVAAILWHSRDGVQSIWV